LLPVHRIDRETSGIVMFARTETAQTLLIRQFAAHSVHRRYLCVVPGNVPAQTLRSVQIRDRGDGLRGSADETDPEAASGLSMVTHVRPLRRFGGFTELECRLETGRTNQIRIQLAELGHPLCGDVKYRGPFEAPELPDHSGAPRLALHAAELGAVHPQTGMTLRWSSPWPADILRWLADVRRNAGAVPT
jgi:23S rRNA pseudouridine1911/1915/1917 synthase